MEHFDVKSFVNSPQVTDEQAIEAVANAIGNGAYAVFSHEDHPSGELSVVNTGGPYSIVVGSDVYDLEGWNDNASDAAALAFELWTLDSEEARKQHLDSIGIIPK